MKTTIFQIAGQSLRGLSIASFALLGACGGESGDDKSDKPDGDVDVCALPSGEESLGKVTKFEGTSATVAFPGSAAGEEYVVMPYTLGNLATVNGDEEKTAFNFTVEAGDGKVLGIQELRREPFEIKGLTGAPASRLMSEVDLDHARRSIINRFNPYLPEGQDESFWKLVRRVDDADRRSQGYVSSNKSLESVLRAQEAAVKSSEKYKSRMLNGASFVLNASECPSGEIFVPLMDSGVDVTKVEDAGDFCVVIVDEPTATTTAEIKTAAAEMLTAYKTTVYKNDFAASNGMTFKPAVVVLDFANPAKWPDSLKTRYGVFSAATSAEEGRPMLYMPAAIQGESGTAAKNNWYATLVHEMQHAIVEYFRMYATTDKLREIAQLDEGLAHFFEDIFGFGALGFNSFAGTYLSLWYNENPAIKDGELGDINVQRGAGHALWYYLASRKGGMEFTDGKLSGGKGLEFIRAAATNAKLKGPQGLQAAFGCDWTETMGNFYGALSVDGSSFAAIPARFKTQGSVGNVKDLLGATTSYGFSFNGSYGKPKDRVWEDDRNLTELPRTIEDVPYYAPAPFIYKVVDPAATLKISISAASENTAVSVVRIK